MQTQVERKRVGWSVTQAGPAAAIAQMQRVTQSQTYRHRKGENGSIEMTAHTYVAQLASNDETDASAFIVSLETEALKPALRLLGTDFLIREWHDAMNAEPAAEARMKRALRCNDWDEFIEAHMDEARVQMRIVALTEILVLEKGINPNLWTRDGHRIITANNK